MPFLILSILLQAILVLHIIKTGRNTTWIWVVTMLPVAGSIAYFVVELLPGFMNTRVAKSTTRQAKKAVNPNGSLKDAARNYNISDTVENTVALADELVAKNMNEEAVKLYRGCLKGTFQYDPAIMTKLAFALFDCGDFKGSLECLDDLIEHNPDFKHADAHLLYARCLDELNETEAAIHEYETLASYYPGPEANYRFALMLINLDRSDEAREYLEQILKRADESAAHYSTLHAEWLSKTKNLLKTC